MDQGEGRVVELPGSKTGHGQRPNRFVSGRRGVMLLTWLQHSAATLSPKYSGHGRRKDYYRGNVILATARTDSKPIVQ